MRARNWTKLSWWQKTRLTAIALCGFAILPSLVIVVFVSALSGTNSLGSISWLAFSVFPLFVVVMIATLARLQQRINLRGNAAGKNKKTTGEGVMR